MSLVDEDAKRVALNKYYGTAISNEELRKMVFVLKAYEQAKLDKAKNRLV